MRQSIPKWVSVCCVVTVHAHTLTQDGSLGNSIRLAEVKFNHVRDFSNCKVRATSAKSSRLKLRWWRRQCGESKVVEVCKQSSRVGKTQQKRAFVSEGIPPHLVECKWSHAWVETTQGSGRDHLELTQLHVHRKLWRVPGSTVQTGVVHRTVLPK